ncbi:hypothetical protein [Microcystis phage Mae-Yong924-2]|nr:hypothetical protein [Microcystis phage Mea-Yong924-1]QYC50711.1 hypothetical protein [Microcystis phage Mae-Yong924-2]
MWTWSNFGPTNSFFHTSKALKYKAPKGLLGSEGAFST